MVNDDGGLELQVTEHHVVKKNGQPQFALFLVLGIILGLCGAIAAIITPLALIIDRDADRERDQVTANALHDLTESNRELTQANADLNRAANCRAQLQAGLQAANYTADAYSIELLIEVAEQFDRVLRDQEPARDALRPRIDAARLALARARAENSIFVARIDECALRGPGGPDD